MTTKSIKLAAVQMQCEARHVEENLADPTHFVEQAATDGPNVGRPLRALIALLVLGLAHGAAAAPPNLKPHFLRAEPRCTQYDGMGDDLLTAGLGTSGLQDAVPPGFADPLNPTAAELRRRAIYSNYRALLDMTDSGGYGLLYGPNIDADGNDTRGEGKIAGEECLAYADNGSGRQNVTMMVQIPDGFNPKNACIVTAPSSGSRGVYGAIGTAGEWGLKRGCAIAYTDKGTGMGTHDLQNDTVNLIDGLRERADAAGKDSNFTAPLNDAQRAAFNAATPERFAFKHAHSRQNPEQDWGENVLQSIRFAFWLLNERFGGDTGHGRFERRTLDKDNTLVIASSVSNGGGASLLAAELDRSGLIDGVAVAEPQIQPLPAPKLTVRRGGIAVPSQARGLFDYTTIANLYQPCARLASSVESVPGAAFVNAAIAANRCAALAAAGLLSGTDTASQAEDALARLRAAGWEADSDVLHASLYAFATPAIAVTYANAYGRARVTDNTCAFSFGATDATGAPVAAPAANVAQIFANGNGIPPTGGINILNNDSLGGPLLDAVSLSADGVQDFNNAGALCLRALAAGADPLTGRRLRGPLAAQAVRVAAGVRAVRARGDLHRTPTIIVHGRADGLVPVNHASRPYVALNALVERGRSRLVYYEVTNAQHFDSFIGLPALLGGYDTRFVPLHLYFLRAMDLMYAHLKFGAPLPPSQVVRTVPRGGMLGEAPTITSANVPPIQPVPAADDLIHVAPGTIDVPN